MNASINDLKLQEFLAKGGVICQLEAEPIRKISTVPAKTQLLALLKRGAMHRDELLKHIDERTLKAGYRNIRSCGIPIITTNGWYALDSDDLIEKVIEIKHPTKPVVKITETQIAYAVSKYYLNSKHLLVVNNYYWTGYECDLFCITKTLKPIEFEIKISRSDFFADAKKDKWKSEPKVWKHYYIMPLDIYSDDLVERLPHPNSGILVVSYSNDAIWINERKKAVANKVLAVQPQQLVDTARLVSMRLWRGAA